MRAHTETRDRGPSLWEREDRATPTSAANPRNKPDQRGPPLTHGAGPRNRSLRWRNRRTGTLPGSCFPGATASALSFLSPVHLAEQRLEWARAPLAGRSLRGSPAGKQAVRGDGMSASAVPGTGAQKAAVTPRRPGSREHGTRQPAPGPMLYLRPPRFARPALQFYAFDAGYIEGLCAGDLQTQEHFVGYFTDLIHLKLRSRLRSGQAIEDVRQETFARVLATLRKENGLRQPDRLGAFVNTVCNNVLFEHYRATSRSESLDEEDRPELPAAGASAHDLAAGESTEGQGAGNSGRDAAARPWRAEGGFPRRARSRRCLPGVWRGWRVSAGSAVPGQAELQSRICAAHGRRSQCGETLKRLTGHAHHFLERKGRPSPWIIVKLWS